MIIRFRRIAAANARHIAAHHVIVQVDAGPGDARDAVETETSRRQEILPGDRDPTIHVVAVSVQLSDEELEEVELAATAAARAMSRLRIDSPSRYRDKYGEKRRTKGSAWPSGDRDT